MNPWLSSYKSHLGNVGLGRAIAYYTEKCIPVMIPLNDTQKYDLVVDIDNSLKRVSVKTTRFKSKSQNYCVLLKKCGGSSGKATIKNFNKADCDILFVLTGDNVMYEIPTDVIDVKTALTLTSKWDEYKVLYNLRYECS